MALSAEAKDLISRMLCVDVSKRITMADIQVHSISAVLGVIAEHCSAASLCGKACSEHRLLHSSEGRIRLYTMLLTCDPVLLHRV